MVYSVTNNPLFKIVYINYDGYSTSWFHYLMPSRLNKVFNTLLTDFNARLIYFPYFQNVY